MDRTKYYNPYISDSESDSGSESDNNTTSSVESFQTSPLEPGQNFAQLARNLLQPSSNFSSTNIGGPTFNTIENQVLYTKGRNYALYNSSNDNIDSGISTSTLYIPQNTGSTSNLLNASRQQVTSIINLDSTDRDKVVYSQPTNLQLRLPRTYKNIINFQIVQIKLLSAFYYFRKSKQNISISINEQGRYLDLQGNVVTGSNVTNPNFPKVLNIITNSIREGSYDIVSLINELITQLNNVPIFYDFIGGFSDFVPLFASTGDYSVGFNLPGDYYFNSVTNEFITNPTIEQIVTNYFKSRYAGQTSYSINNIKIAYYYPVLKEILLDNNYFGNPIDFTNADSNQLLPGETPTTRCIYYFQGLNDSYVLSVILTNVLNLDSYRLKHTFRYNLINKYNVFYDTFNNHITINTDSLNTSLYNLIIGKQALYYNQQFSKYGITSNQFASLATQNTLLLAVLTDMYNYLQYYFATVFGVQYNTYALDYFGNLSNLIYLQNGFNANVSSNYDINVIQNSNNPISNNILSNFQNPPQYYWPSLGTNPSSNFSNGTNISYYNGNPYNLQADIPEEYHPLVDLSTETIYSSRLLNHVDCVANINPASYTVFKFKSAYRQTLKVETLPRPTKYRYPEYNAITYDASHVALFDNSYNYIFNSSNNVLVNSNISINSIPGFTSISQSNFAINLSNSYALWSNTYATITSAQTEDFYSFIPPLPNSSNSIAYKYNLNINISAYPLGTTFPSAIDIFIYRDIAAFYADISGATNESKYNYLSSNLIPTTVSNVDITFEAYQLPSVTQTFYVIVRSQNTNPQLVNYVVTPYFTSSNYTALSNSLSNFNPLADPQSQQNLNNFLYSRSYDTNYVHLPSYSNLYQGTPDKSFFADLSYNEVPMGYDTNGVSTDLTHYIGYIQNQPNSNVIPSATFRVDPITQYVFKVANGSNSYNSTTQTYFYTNTSNKLFTPQAASNYTPTTPATRQFSQVHYYANTYLSNSKNQPPLESYYISPYVASYNSNLYSNTLSGYLLDSSGNLQFGNGIYGLSLIPGQGTWDIQRYMFKSVFNQNSWSQPNTQYYTSDPNLNIKYLGIYYNSVLVHQNISNISLTNSIAVLEYSVHNVYNSSNIDFGFGSEGGTYYEFIRNYSFRNDYYSYLYGFTENSNTITNDLNNGYTILAFDANSRIIPFIGITGSTVPYPYYSDAIASNTYLDGTTGVYGNSLIVPQVKSSPDSNRGPPSSTNQTQSQYEQSMPIGTTYQAYSSNSQIINSTIYPFSNIGFTVDRIITDISGFLLTQTTDFQLYTYDNTSNRQFTFKNSFTIDEIFGSFNSNMSFVNVAANTSEYAFLVLSNNGGQINLLINTYNPTTYSITNRINAPISGFLYSSIVYQSFQNFTYNNYGGFNFSFIEDYGTSNLNFVVSQPSAPSNPSILDSYNTFIYSSNISYTNTSNTITNITKTSSDPASISYFTVYQNPQENMGRFYVGIYGTSGINQLHYVDPSIKIPFSNWSQQSNYLCYSITNTINKITAYSLNINLDQIAITRSPVQDIIYGFALSNPTKFYQVTSYTSASLPYNSNAIFTQSSNTFSTNVKEIEAGFNGALWFNDNTGIIYGNRNIFIDGVSDVLIYSWQIFYPTQRVIYNNISKSVNLLPDLSGLEYPELYHTELFFYNNSNSFAQDLLPNGNVCPWGNEQSSNFYISDTHFSGYYFNAFTSCIPLEPSSNEYYLAVRNYSPTEKSQVYMRFSLPNRYDFGYTSFTDISNETLLLSSNPQLFNPNYSSNLRAFNNNFIFSSKIFGSNIVPGFYGVDISNVTGFGNFMSNFQTYYNTYLSNITLINDITNAVNSNLSNFISYDLQYIIPPTAANRQNPTDPLLFSILWKTALTPSFVNLQDNWGLGWNLGYEKLDTPYDTVQIAPSFYKILDDYIILRLNDEFDVNRVDTTAKEKLSATLESTGATKAYYGKLLLAPFGSYAQTMVMNPISFNPPLGRLDKLSFSWYNNNTGTVIDNSDCEWNAVIQIVENIDVVTINNPPLIYPQLSGP